MSVNGYLTEADVYIPTPQEQLAHIDHEINKCVSKLKSLEEYRRELINRHDLNKVNKP